MENNHLSTSCDSDQEQEQINRRKKRTKDQLEEVRRNALAAKRNLCARPINKPKTSFMKTLHQFAAKRKEITDANGNRGLLLNRSKDNDIQIIPVPRTLQTKGFFRGGVKGKLINRPIESHCKLKNAVLNNDILQLLQSGNYSNQEISKKLPTEDTDSDIRIEVAKILKSSSQYSSSINGLLSSEKEERSSPVLNNANCKIKEKNLTKFVTQETQNLMPSQKVQSPVMNQMKLFHKEKKFKRRLFEDEFYIRNQNPQIPYHNQNNALLKDSLEKSVPENVIFSFEHTSPEDKVYIPSRKKNKINPMNKQIIRRYIKTSELVNKEEIKNFLWIDNEDPLQSTLAALKATYTRTHVKFLNKQNKINVEESSNSTAGTIISSNSEIILEPDSAIRRTLMKNRKFKKKDIICNSEINSDWSSNELDDLELFTVIDSLDYNLSDKKCLTSTKKSWQEEKKIPLSTKVNVDPDSAKTKLKLSVVDENRRELMIRYFNDVNANKACLKEKYDSLESFEANDDNAYYSDRETFLKNDSIVNNYLIPKSTKHVPAILRKNRSSSIEKYPNPSVATNRNIVNGNFGLETKKTDYFHVNAKYNNKKSKKDMPLETMQIGQLEKTAPEMRLFESPKVTDKPFSIAQNNFCISPIDQRKNFNNQRQNILKYYSSQETLERDSQNFYRCHSSQGDSVQENNCMIKVLSFGDIQERTNRLTLHSSQNQNCSQGSREQVEFHKFHPHHNHNYDCHKQKCSFSENYNSQLCTSYNEVPTPQLFNIPIHSKDYGRFNSNCRQSNERQYLPVSFRNECNLMPSKNNYLVRDSKNLSYQVNNQVNESKTYAPVHHQNFEQAVKFIAIGENSVPQKQPVYRMHENSYVHKVSNPSQQCALMAKPLYSENVSSAARYVTPIPLYQFHEHGPTSQAIVNSDFECNGSCNLISANQNRKFNENNMVSNQVLVTGQNIPICSIANEQKFIGQKMLVPKHSSPYSQVVEYQPPIYFVNNEGSTINNAYLQELNNQHLLYSKRS